METNEKNSDMDRFYLVTILDIEFDLSWVIKDSDGNSAINKAREEFISNDKLKHLHGYSNRMEAEELIINNNDVLFFYHNGHTGWG